MITVAEYVERLKAALDEAFKEVDLAQPVTLADFGRSMMASSAATRAVAEELRWTREQLVEDQRRAETGNAPK